MQTNQTSPSNVNRHNGKILKKTSTSLRRIIRKQINSYRRKEDKRAVLESLAIIHEENTDSQKKVDPDKCFYASRDAYFLFNLKNIGHCKTREKIVIYH